VTGRSLPCGAYIYPQAEALTHPAVIPCALVEATICMRYRDTRPGTRDVMQVKIATASSISHCWRLTQSG
jgi:hypothetical protein